MDIRPMLPDEVDAATEMVLRHGWGVRRDWLAFAATSDRCRAIVAEAGGEIVATGVGTANGPVGWLGSVFVAPELRGHGLGRAVTQAVLDWLEAAGCATVVLVATDEGRRLYERMGFDVQASYRILEAPGLDGTEKAYAEHALVRPFESGDLDAMATLDRRATGEDRRHLLERFAAPDTARIASSAGGSVAGFLVRPPWGGGATVAATPDDALAMITARRRTAGPAGRVRVGVLDENEAGIARLLAGGFREAWSAPRMIRGASIDWRPELIWGQFNHAVG
jgi:GNAT superfamily N-acetyltransferase